MNMKRFSLMMVAALGALLAAAVGARAGDVNCTSFLTPQTINGNLNVPANVICFVTGAVSVTGNVTVGHNAYLFIDTAPPSNIAGNVQGNGCGYVWLQNVVVGGNFQGGNCTENIQGNITGLLSIGSTINGDFQCNNNAGMNTFTCYLSNSTVGGNVQINNNVTSAVGPVISGSIIKKNLQCQNNSPAPTNLGSPNTVLGNPDQSSEGQCQGL